MAKKTKEPIDNYTEDTELDESYRTQQGVLDASKRKAQQNADVSYQMLQKYLPIQNRASGMHGLGVSEGAMIDANNRYMSRMGDIEANHAVGSATLLNNYRAEKTAAQDKAYAEAVATLGSGAIATGDELDSYLSVMEGKVAPEQMEALKRSGEAMTTRIKTNHVTPRNGSFIQGDETAMYFEDNKGKFRVTVNEKDVVTDPQILKAAQKVGERESFMIGDKLYLKQNGKVYPVNTEDYQRLYNKFHTS